MCSRCDFGYAARSRDGECNGKYFVYDGPTNIIVVLVVQRFGVGLVIERSLVRLPVGALSSQLGQLSLPSLWGR